MPRTDRLPRRRLDPEQRRAAILDAAREAFAAAPYAAVSVAGIATAAASSEALVHRYFTSKSGLYQAVVAESIDELLTRQVAADTALGSRAAVRLRLATSIEVYLEVISNSPVGWAAPLRDPHHDVPAAAELRARARDRYVELLRGILGLAPAPARDHALYGYLGFLDAACLSWVALGCPPEQRGALVAMAVAALAGALDATGTPHALA
ncbi:TetR/AcrR family transcriptional regulator [Modestobacter sp. SSW1-42]|uniref:TetR/AcrR family transcriptional regulator n=1 Tax=Modestobacter sp. SSW1-42 TaxID=596372 RepID=UPI0039857EBC